MQYKVKHRNTKEAYTDDSKIMGKKVGFAAVFMNVIRRAALPEEASIHTTEMTAIKIALKEIHKRQDKMGNAVYIYFQSSVQKSKHKLKNHTEKSPCIHRN